MVAMGSPHSFSMRASMSNRGLSSRSAMIRATVLLPLPERPIKKRLCMLVDFLTSDRGTQNSQQAECSGIYGDQSVCSSYFGADKGLGAVIVYLILVAKGEDK